jgi:hypothetical protein
MRSEDQLLSNKKLFANNWSSVLICECFRSLAKKFCTWDIICEKFSNILRVAPIIVIYVSRAL